MTTIRVWGFRFTKESHSFTDELKLQRLTRELSKNVLTAHDHFWREFKFKLSIT